MNKLWLVFFVSIIVGCQGMFGKRSDVLSADDTDSVRTQEEVSLKGEYAGNENGVSYTLFIDPSGSTVSEGMVTAEPASEEFRVLKNAGPIKCYGFLKMAMAERSMKYNIVAFDEGDEEMVPELVMIEQYDTDLDEGIVTVDLFTGESDGSIVISDSRDIDEPLFENLILTKVE